MNILLIDNNDSFTRNLEHLLASAVPGAVIDCCAACIAAVRQPRRSPISSCSRPGRALRRTIPAAAGSSAPGNRSSASASACRSSTSTSAARPAACPAASTAKPKPSSGTADRGPWRATIPCMSPAWGKGLDVTARSGSGTVMAVASREQRVIGYQFHPESFLTVQRRRIHCRSRRFSRPQSARRDLTRLPANWLTPWRRTLSCLRPAIRRRQSLSPESDPWTSSFSHRPRPADDVREFLLRHARHRHGIRQLYLRHAPARLSRPTSRPAFRWAISKNMRP